MPVQVFAVGKIDVPDNPVDPVNPIGPVDPVNPIGPVDPVHPIEPVGPVELVIATLLTNNLPGI